MVGDLEPEMLGDALCFSLRLIPGTVVPSPPPHLYKGALESVTQFRKQLCSQKAPTPIPYSIGAWAGSIRGKLWKMGTKFSLPFSKPKDCMWHLRHRIRVSPWGWCTLTLRGICCWHCLDLLSKMGMWPNPSSLSKPLSSHFSSPSPNQSDSDVKQTWILIPFTSCVTLGRPLLLSELPLTYL